MDAKKLMIMAFILTIFGILVAAGAAYKKGYVNFMSKSHLYGLIFFLISSITFWAGMNFISHTDKFSWDTKSIVSLVASILIAFLTFIRFSYVVTNT